MKRRRRLGTAPRRLALGDPAALETRLVREARREAPPPGASGRALVALGLATGAATAASAASSAEAAVAKGASAKAATATAVTEGAVTKLAGATSVAAVGAPVAGATKGVLGISLSTWLAGGVVAVAATVGVARVASSPDPARSPIAASVAPPVSAAPSAPVTASPRASGANEPQPPHEPTEPISPSAEPPRATAKSTTAPALSAVPNDGDAPPAPPVSATTAPPAPASSTLGREVALVDGARAALANGDEAGALRLLDTYDREFPSGTLAPESARLRAKAQAPRSP